MSRASKAASQYSKMTDVERCAMAGKMLRRIWFARIYQPDAVDRLLTCKVCGLAPSVPERPCEQCKPKYRVARESQIPDWMLRDDKIRTMIYLGGRSSGKTMSASGWWMPEILERPNFRLSIIGPTYKISERVGILGQSGLKTLIEEFDKTLVADYNKVDKILTLVNGSQVFCFTSENTSSIEGPEYHGLWVDEVAELIGAGGDDCIYRVKAEPGVRLVGDKGEPIRKIVTGTPDATELITNLHESYEKRPDRYGFRELATRENLDNVDRVMFEQMYEETDKSSVHYISKLEGKLLLSSPRALLGESQLAAIRCPDGDPRRRDPSQMEKTVLAVDANHSDDVKSDECGIVVIGRLEGRGYVFADASCKGGSDEWGERIIEALIAYPEIRELACEDEGLVVDVVKRVLSDDDALERIGRVVKIKKMPHGNKSKKKRADPVSALYARKRMLHCPCARTPDWSLEKLEWQWKSWNPNKTGAKAKSPDRLDACVYGATRLLLREATPNSFQKPSDVSKWIA